MDGASSAARRLPKWADHPGHDKTSELTKHGLGPEPAVVEWIADLQRKLDRPLRILDAGAGRGDLVAWLCAHGYDAYGVEPNKRYVENGCRFFASAGLGEDRVRTFLPDGSYPFEDGEFDLVHSNQVVEHVEDIEAFGREVSRVTRRGGRGVHIFPAKWELMEGHMHMPLGHWFPKGAARRIWIKLALRTGQAAQYFADLNLEDRTEVFQRFSEDETFYRTSREVSRVLDRYGMDSDRTSLAAARLRRSGFPALLAPAFVAFREAYITTVKR